MNERSPQVTILHDNVEEQSLYLGGRWWRHSAGDFQRLLPRDVGKRMILVGNVLQLETEDQRHARWIHTSQLPRGGDAVRCAARWAWGDCPEGSLPVGSFGIINGSVEHDIKDFAQITFHYSAFIDDRCASISGGPGTIATPIGELQATNKTLRIDAWQWKDGISGGGRGRYYKRECRVWDWYPDSIVIPEPTAEAVHAELLERISRCRNHGEITGNGVVFDYELAGPGGASFELFREEHHTDKDMSEAKDWLRGSRDVVTIHITTVK